MKCPVCQAETLSGQKYCGACGHKLEKDCSECGASNPPTYNFCGSCGHNLATSGSIALARSGLIAEIDPKAVALLGRQTEEMVGKAFSLFMAREDLPVFFSHWNALLSSSEKQVLELALNHKNGKKIYVLMECTYDKDAETQAPLIHLNLHDISDRQLALDQSQYQQDMLNLIFNLADNVRTVSDRHLDSPIADALKKISLFTKADRSFIYRLDRKEKHLQLSHQWPQPSGGGNKTKSKRVPMAMIKNCIIRLIQNRSYVVDNVADLPPSERDELLAWQQADLGAVMCHLIYNRRHPIGIIGVAKTQGIDPWPPECIALVKLFGQILSDLLPFGSADAPAPALSLQDTLENNRRNKGSGSRIAPSPPGPAGHPREMKASAKPAAKSRAKPLPGSGKPMQFEKITGDQALERQTLFPRDDGLILVTCPHCGVQESVPLGRFEKLGNAVTVQCSCQKQFAAVLEKRRAFRKAVHLEGFFTISGESEATDTKSSIWGPMLVKNISKTGLRFHTKQVDLIRPGNLLMVRFNLDNSNKALIHKQVEVISINGQEVGCRFKGADRYDITLGFYFI